MTNDELISSIAFDLPRIREESNGALKRCVAAAAFTATMTDPGQKIDIMLETLIAFRASVSMTIVATIVAMHPQLKFTELQLYALTGFLIRSIETMNKHDERVSNMAETFEAQR